MAEDKNKKRIPLQSKLPPPFIPPLYKSQTIFSTNQKRISKSYPSRTVSTEEPIPTQYINLSNTLSKSMGNLSIPQFAGHELSLASLTRTDTNTSRLSIASTFASPEYSTLPPMTDVLSSALDIDNQQKGYEGLYDADHVLDLTDITPTQCPQNNASSNKNSSYHHNEPNKSNNNNNRRKHNKEHQKRSQNNDNDDDKMDENDEEYNEQSAIHWRNTESSYSPHPKYKAQGFIKIPNHFTDTVVPNAIYEEIPNVYDFINKSTAMLSLPPNALPFDCNDDSIIYNYDFHDINNEDILYCIADRVYGNTKCKYKMRDKLYREKEICNEYYLPKSCRYTKESLLNHVQMVEDALMPCIGDVLLNKTKWNRVRVFNAKLIDNKQCKKEYNKQRLTFSITKTEFEVILKRFVCNINNVSLIPMVMFNNDGYRVEYLQIIRIRDNVDIGISYLNNMVTGIHLNRECIMNQHQLIYPGHHCHCLDGFRSQIDNLRIGNPDEDINRYKDVKSRRNEEIKELNKENEKLNKALGQLQLQYNNALQPIQLNQLPNYPNINQLLNMLQINVHNMPSNCFILSNTPQTASTTTSFTPALELVYGSRPNTNTTPFNGSNVANGYPNTIWPAPPTHITLSNQARSFPSN